MMSVIIAVNGKPIRHISILNRGPIGDYAEGDRYGGDGPRRYEWTDGTKEGEVVHRRGDGAVPLVQLVLAHIADMESSGDATG
jgi:hypothetical protein